MSSPYCTVCSESMLISDCAKQKRLLPADIAILRPLSCSKCDKCFPDEDSLKTHLIIHKTNVTAKTKWQNDCVSNRFSS